MAARKPKAETPQVMAVTDQERVVLITQGYGHACSVCKQRMEGGQKLTLDGSNAPAHAMCVDDTLTHTWS